MKYINSWGKEEGRWRGKQLHLPRTRSNINITHCRDSASSLILVLLSPEKKKNPALTQLARFLLLSYIYAPGYNRDVHRQRRVHTQALCGRKKRLMIIYRAFILSCVTRERIKPQKRGTSININICKKEICTVIVRHNPSISEPADTNTTPIERTIICCFNSQRIAENTICSVLREQRLWD